MIGFFGAGAQTAVQLGYTLADIVSKVGLGLLACIISVRKSAAEMSQATVSGGPRVMGQEMARHPLRPTLAAAAGLASRLAAPAPGAVHAA